MLRPLRPLGIALLLLLVAAPAGVARARRDFPRGFLWGTAIAGFQTEMGGPRPHADPHSDWWVWSRDRDNIATRKVSGDLPERGPGHWSVYRRDLDIVRGRLHNNSFRLSIEWSRIFPRSTRAVDVGRRLDRADLRRLDRLASKPALRHYLRELDAIRRRHLKAFVTVNHFSLPSWIHDPIAARDAIARVGPNEPPPTGFGPAGWLDARTVGEFRKYAAYLAWKLRGRVDLWAPINEPVVVVAAGYFNVPGVFAAFFPPGVFSFTGARQALLNLERGNTAAYDAIKRFDPGARVGVVENMIAFTPADPSSARDRVATRHADKLYNRLFIDAAVRGDIDANADGVIQPAERHRHGRKADFVGVNYYFRGRITGTGAPLSPAIPLLDFVPATSYRWALAPTAPPCPTTCSEFGSEIYPQGFRTVLREAGSYHLPVYVTENGIADGDDDQRPAYLRSHLRVLRDVIRAHLARVRGYFEWSLVDNFEWASGYTPKFGLYSFDRRTLRRTARPSALLYARLARTGRIP